MKEQQAKSDERDNRRVFVWGVLAAIIVMLGALAYFYAIQRHFEAPLEMPPPQGTPTEAPGAAPGK